MDAKGVELVDITKGVLAVRRSVLVVADQGNQFWVGHKHSSNVAAKKSFYMETASVPTQTRCWKPKSW